jgi:hypothetical protein
VPDISGSRFSIFDLFGASQDDGDDGFSAKSSAPQRAPQSRIWSAQSGPSGLSQGASGFRSSQSSGSSFGSGGSGSSQSAGSSQGSFGSFSRPQGRIWMPSSPSSQSSSSSSGASSAWSSRSSYISSWDDDDDFGSSSAKSSPLSVSSVYALAGFGGPAHLSTSDVKKRLSLMTDEILGIGAFKNRGDTPAVDLTGRDAGVLIAKKNHATVAGSKSFQGPCEYTVGQQPADGIMRVTIMAPVSGHTGADNARKWAKSDSFNVKVTLPDGTVLKKSGLRSKDLVTMADVDFPAQKGKTKIEYWRDGSFGVGGYGSGRTIYIHN